MISKGYLVIFLILIALSVNAENHIEILNTSKRDVVPLWKADSFFYSIEDVDIFPIIESDGNNFFFEKAYVTWITSFENQRIPMFAIIDKGFPGKITSIQNSLSHYWQSFGSELLFIGTTQDTTFFEWFSTGHPQTSAVISGITYNHSAYFDTNENGWVIYFENITASYFAKWDGFSISIVKTNEDIIDSWQFFRLVYDTSSNTSYLDDGVSQTLLPFNLSSSLKLAPIGIVDQYPYIDMAVVNMKTNSYFYRNKTNPIPFKIAQLFKNTFPSATLLDNNGFSYLFNGTAWIPDIEFSIFPLALGSVTFLTKISVVPFFPLGYQFIGSDIDNDSLPDEIELYIGSSSISSDTDGDLMDDFFEVAYGLDPTKSDSNFDVDGDGLTNYDEYLEGLDPQLADTDWGGALDGWELRYSFDPHNKTDDLMDSDADGLSNYLENKIGTNPLIKDSDSDGIPDGWEYYNSLDPLSKDEKMDPDADGINNLEEYYSNHHPFVPDNPFPISKILLILISITIVCTIPSFLLTKKIHSSEYNVA